MISFTIENMIHNYNGYVVVDKTYSIYGEEYDRLPLDVHWGLTFGCSLEECKKDFPHIYEKYLSIDWTSEEDDVWIYWFDTVHYGDEPYERDKVRVSVEIHNLIEQIEKYKI